MPKRALNWTAKSPLPTARLDPAAIVVDGKIYLFGGRQFKEKVEGYIFTVPADAVLAYDIATDAWNTVTTMPTPRSGCAVFRYGTDKIYVVGGFEKKPGQWTKSSAMEVYDLTTHTWSPGGTFVMPPTHYGTVLVKGRCIYAIGGLGGEASGFNHSNYVFCHDLQDGTSSWPGSFRPMPTPRSLLTTVVGKDGLIYALGGLDDSGALATVEAYDPDADEWHTRAPMLRPRRQFDAVVGPNGHIYVFGGMSGGAAVPWVEVYDPEADSWTPAPDLPGQRMSHAAVIDDTNRVFIIGGTEKESCHADPVFLSSVLASAQPVTD